MGTAAARVSEPGGAAGRLRGGYRRRAGTALSRVPPGNQHAPFGPAPRDAMRSSLRAALRMTGYLVLTAVLLPVQIVAVLLDRPLARRLPVFYHGLCCRLLGFTVTVKGRRSAHRPILFVSNHISYIDVMTLGSLIPGSFIARAEIAGWPLFGLLARLQRTVFIDRLGSRVTEQRDEISARLAAGDDLILFPEGTSDDGNSVLPFKSALFAVAERDAGGKPVQVQPVSIAYTRLDGMPIGRYLRPHYAWYGDMSLIPHLWEMLGFGRVTVMVEFHPLVVGTEFASRKALAEHCYQVIASGVEAANSGRAVGELIPGLAGS